MVYEFKIKKKGFSLRKKEEKIIQVIGEDEYWALNNAIHMYPKYEVNLI